MKTKKRSCQLVIAFVCCVMFFSQYSYASVQVHVNTDLEFHEQVLGAEKSRISKEIAVSKKSKIRLYDTMQPREPHDVHIYHKSATEVDQVPERRYTFVEYNHNIELPVEENPAYAASDPEPAPVLYLIPELESDSISDEESAFSDQEQIEVLVLHSALESDSNAELVLAPVFEERFYFKQKHREVVKNYLSSVEKSKLEEVIAKIDVSLASVDNLKTSDFLHGIRYVSMEVLNK